MVMGDTTFYDIPGILQNTGKEFVVNAMLLRAWFFIEKDAGQIAGNLAGAATWFNIYIRLKMKRVAAS